MKKSEIDAMKRIIGELHWMARRYATGRMSVAPGLFNDIVREILKLGIPLKKNVHEPIWAEDGMGKSFDGLTDEQRTPGTESAAGDWYVTERVNVCDEIAKILGTNQPEAVYRELLRLKKKAGE